MESRITIFTDGASKGNPGRGGYGVVVASFDTVTELGAYKERTTNNEMELLAVIEALTLVQGTTSAVDIYTDSKYVVDGATGWVFGWLKNGWKTKAKAEVANKELWQRLVPLMRTTAITWHKVPGHVGIVGNERADTIASTFAETGAFDLYLGSRLEYGYDISKVEFDETKKQDRSDARKRQAQKAYSYVSSVGGVVEVHSTWAECERRVKGQKGTRFKKSLDGADEKAIIKDFSGQ